MLGREADPPYARPMISHLLEIDTVLGPTPPVTGSMNVTGLLTQGLEDLLGARFAVEPDPVEAAQWMLSRIEGKRKGLGLNSR